MRLVILAAGPGMRLRPLTGTTPKALISFGGETIIEMCVRCFASWDVTEVAVVVGHQAQQIKDLLGTEVFGTQITYYTNPLYASTSTAYSAWLARDFFSGRDCIIIEGDHIIDVRLIGSLMSNSYPNLLLVDDADRKFGDDTVVVGSDGVVERMIYPADTIVGRAAQLARLGPVASKALAQELAKLKDTQDWVHALNATFARVEFHYIGTGGLVWTEIDTQSDLEYADSLFKRGLIDTGDAHG